MLASCDEPLRTAFDLALVDLDGVVYRGREAVPHAAEQLLAAGSVGMKISYVTNNSAREPAEVAGQIRSYGLPCRDDDVYTSAQSAARLLTDQLPRGARVLPIGGPGLRRALDAAGFGLCSSAAEQPAAVVQGFWPELTWRDLAEAAYAINAGALHLATNLDAAIPDARGIAPGNGALVNAVVAATGKQPLASGKPRADIFQQAARHHGARRPLVIGDRLDTDLQGARAADMPGMLVLTGITGVHDAIEAPPAQRPSFVAADLRDLAHAHPAPEAVEGGWWACGEAVATVQQGELRLASRTAPGRARGLHQDMAVTLDEWRALCAAAWHHTDTGGEAVKPPRLRLDAGREG